jgi:hypothetical protein
MSCSAQRFSNATNADNNGADKHTRLHRQNRPQAWLASLNQALPGASGAMAKTRDHLARGTTALRLSNEDPYPLSGTIDAAGLGGLRASQGTRVGMRGYFPRAVFFFFFGFAVFSVLPEVASFFGRFGDTGSLLLWLAVLRCSLVCSRWAIPARPAAGRAARRYRSASPPCQSMEPFAATPETAIVNGCCNRRLAVGHASPGRHGGCPCPSPPLRPGRGRCVRVDASRRWLADRACGCDDPSDGPLPATLCACDSP